MDSYVASIDNHGDRTVRSAVRLGPDLPVLSATRVAVIAAFLVVVSSRVPCIGLRRSATGALFAGRRRYHGDRSESTFLAPAMAFYEVRLNTFVYHGNGFLCYLPAPVCTQTIDGLSL